jgi:Na+/melibiose symporter-like transporter
VVKYIKFYFEDTVMKLNYKRTFFVGFAFFLICTFWQAYDTIVPKILTDKFGLGQTWSGAVMAMDNIFALFLLPLFGTLSDKCKSKMGRRSPFILFGTVIACVAFVLMSVADNSQLKRMEAVAPTAESAQTILYNENLTIKTPDGESVNVCERFTLEEYTAIPMYNEDGGVTEEYTDYVVPARQAYAARLTEADPSSLIFFMAMLLFALLAMSTFRSPAVALMPDVTLKPLRSKANAVINLMGAVGGIIVLVLGMVFATGKAENALMSYTAFFIVIAAIMLVSLIMFFITVREPRFVREMQEESARLGIDTADDEEKGSGGKMSKNEFRSLLFILASVVLWFMGYNAVTSSIPFMPPPSLILIITPLLR